MELLEIVIKKQRVNGHMFLLIGHRQCYECGAEGAGEEQLEMDDVYEYDYYI